MASQHDGNGFLFLPPSELQVHYKQIIVINRDYCVRECQSGNIITFAINPMNEQYANCKFLASLQTDCIRRMKYVRGQRVLAQ